MRGVNRGAWPLRASSTLGFAPEERYANEIKVPPAETSSPLAPTATANGPLVRQYRAHLSPKCQTRQNGHNDLADQPADSLTTQHLRLYAITPRQFSTVQTNYVIASENTAFLHISFLLPLYQQNNDHFPGGEWQISISLREQEL